MDEANDQKRKIEGMKLPLKGEINQGKEAHDEGADGIAFFSAYTVDHLGSPGAAENGRESEGSHDETDIRLLSSMTRNKKREQEKRAEAR